MVHEKFQNHGTSGSEKVFFKDFGHILGIIRAILVM